MKGEVSRSGRRGTGFDSRPALTIPRVEGLSHPVRGALGPHLHDQGVAQVSAQRRVEAAGEAQVAADANPTGGAARPGELRHRARVAGETPGNADGAAAAGPRHEVDAGRDDGRRENQEDSGRGRGRRHQRQHQTPGRDAAAAAGRRPHFGEGPERSSRPTPRRRGRSGGRSPDAPPTAISPAEAPSVKSRSRRLGTWNECTTRTATSRTVNGLSTEVMPLCRRAHCVEEPDARRNGAEGDQRSSPTPAVRPGWRARRPCLPPPAPWLPTPSSRRSLRATPQAAIATQHGGQAGQPQPYRVLRQPRLVGPPYGVDDAHVSPRDRQPPRPRRGPGGGRRCAGRPRARGPGPVASLVPSNTGAPLSEQAARLSRAHLPPPVRPRQGRRGSSTVIVTGSAAGCSTSRTMRRPAWAVARQWTRRRASPGT